MPLDLPGGLRLRRLGAADAEALAAFNADVLRRQDELEPDERTAAWTRDLMSGRHPTFRPSEGTVVEDVRTGAIVSSALLLRQRWAYESVPITVGQPELIGTHRGYRGRGLVRRQLDVLHRWSAERGDDATVISGIPGFYRQFGYELALELGAGRLYFPATMPGLDPAAAAAFRLRPAAEADLTFIAETARHGHGRYLVTLSATATDWRWWLSGQSAAHPHRSVFVVIETLDGRRLGFLGHRSRLWGSGLPVVTYELAPGVSWRAVWVSVLAYLQATGETYAARDGEKVFGSIGFWLGSEHPVYRIFRFPQTMPGFAWYVRVADLTALLRKISPALERRLAGSPLVSHDGELRLGFYTDGVRLGFERGRLVGVERWQPPLDVVGEEQMMPTAAPRPHAMFPGLTFLELLFGFRSVDELRHAFPDVVLRTSEARALLETLFPKRPSDTWAVL
ncbi:MAG: GNAT family N-acetyltransferase [Candidatus Rokuibacteriota bacterium]